MTLEPWMLGLMIPIVSIVGGITYIIIVSTQKARLRELEIRERIAMIERGLVPPPEVDPRGFDRAMSRYERMQAIRGTSAGRHRRSGISLIGIGGGLAVMFWFWGDGDLGLGVGGFLVVFGLALLINSLFERPEPPSAPPTGASPNATAPGS